MCNSSSQSSHPVQIKVFTKRSFIQPYLPQSLNIFVWLPIALKLTVNVSLASNTRSQYLSLMIAVKLSVNEALKWNADYMILWKREVYSFKYYFWNDWQSLTVKLSCWNDNILHGLISVILILFWSVHSKGI